MKTFKEFLNKKTLTPEQLAKKHNCDLETINKQLEKGTKVEKEHTSNSRIAREIALDHIDELPDYYDKLEKMEKK